MPNTLTESERNLLRARNLLAQETIETRQRARLGGWFYAVASGLAFAATGLAPPYRLLAVLVVGGFLLLALIRILLPVPAVADERLARRYLRSIWATVLATAVGWGAFSAWAQHLLPDPGPLIALLFSGAFGMAIAHTLCMRKLAGALAILAVMAPTLVVLWSDVALGVGAMWLVYTVYMLLVMKRSHREYWTRLELEEELRQQRDVFEKQSRLDGLTGLANRREFSATLERAIRANNGDAALSLLILDIDHFKRINDTFGHVAGDACLREFARHLRDAFPGSGGELCARLGGEEFGAVLTVDAASAHARAEAFRSGLERACLTFDGIREAVTVSIGCSSFDASRHADADALYREADAALYRAKLDGRNRTQRARMA